MANVHKFYARVPNSPLYSLLEDEFFVAMQTGAIYDLFICSLSAT